MDLFADERRNIIIDIINKKGSVTVAELMEKFDISIETVRRDLANLEKNKILTRVHGGAILPKTAKKIHLLKERLSENRDKKYKLSKTAAKYIEENDVIFIDSGSTAIELAKVLREEDKKLTVITHSPDVFDILSDVGGIKLIVTGGLYLAEERAFYGSITVDFIKSLHFSKAFVFPSCIDIDNGISINFNELIDIQKATMGSADEIFVLCDSSKLCQSGLFRVCPLNKSFKIITDDGVEDVIVKAFAKSGLTLIR